PDAGRLIEWAKAGALLAAQERLGKARQGIVKRGIPPKALTPAKLTRAKALWADLDMSVETIARELNVSVRTLYRHLPKRRDT
ncbi:helix-turn-helix domain-containing protein, partial [Loigolactobacillus coryniformis]|uniref:helix-turn-helix domain-containing protein n=1 Tax=Loigolactobacillus coryniformis TaxID=1610 RepID=UPI00201A54EC